MINILRVDAWPSLPLFSLHSKPYEADFNLLDTWKLLEQDTTPQPIYSCPRYQHIPLAQTYIGTILSL